MKLVCKTEQYGDRIMIQPDYYRESFFFAGPQPKLKQLILIELPDLPNIPEGEPVSKAIKGWLNRYHQDKQKEGAPETQRERNRRRRLNELPEGVWRDATLDDLLEAQNFHSAVWRVEGLFTLQELSAFADRWLPEAQQTMHDTLAIASENERATALKQMHRFFNRLFLITQQIPYHILKEHRELIRQLETTQVTALRRRIIWPTRGSSNFDTNKWLDLASTLQTENLISSLLMDVAENLAKPGVSQAEMQRVISKVKTNSKLRKHVGRDPLFWQLLSPCLRLDSTVQGETIDISDAQEVTVKLGWPVYEARRVGRIVPKRRALLITGKNNEHTYIGAQRQLKFEVLRAGGRLEKFGNTLIMRQDDSNQLHQALLQVEMLDTLANVAPQEAITHIKHLNLPPHHPIFQTAKAAEEDPKQSRILADLLIELIVGIDADVARRLVRRQGGGRRRR